MYTRGPGSQLLGGQSDMGKQWDTKPRKILPHVAEPNDSLCQQTPELLKHKCPDCGSLFKSKYKFNQHVRTKHVNRCFRCSQCQCAYVTKVGLTEHVKHKHENLVRYRCDTCGKGYTIRSHYYDHLAVHTGDKQNVCHICQKKFTFRSSLKSHMLFLHHTAVPRVLL